MNMRGVNILLLVFFIGIISIKKVEAQQINELLQNQIVKMLDMSPDTSNNSQIYKMGEIYQINNKNRSMHLKSTQREKVTPLLDSLKIFTFQTTNDSILLDYYAKQYNTNNQLINKKIIHKLSYFSEFKYTYNQQNDTSLIEQTFYYDGIKKGVVQDIFEYNEENRLKTITYKSSGSFEKIVRIPRITYMIDPLSTKFPFNSLTEELKFDYSTDSKGRDTMLMIKQYNISISHGITFHNLVSQYTSTFKYYTNNTIREKTEKYDNGLSMLYKYNERGALVYSEKNKWPYQICEYDSNNILRYKKEWLGNDGMDFPLSKTWYITDTLSNASAIYISVVYRNSTLNQKRLILVFYNKEGLISNTRGYIWYNTSNLSDVSYRDTLIYNDQNHISEYYLAAGDDPYSEYQYKELYFYDTAGNKTRYEEYRKNMFDNSYVPVHKEFYYYKNEFKTRTSEIISFEDVRVYPNPASDYLTIENMDIAGLRYKIYNLNGYLIDSGVVHETYKRIDLSLLPPAMYLLKLTSLGKGNLYRTLKIMKL